MRRNSHCIQLTLQRLSPGFFPWRVIDGRLLLLLLLFPLLLLAVRWIVRIRIHKMRHGPSSGCDRSASSLPLPYSARKPARISEAGAASTSSTSVECPNTSAAGDARGRLASSPPRIWALANTRATGCGVVSARLKYSAILPVRCRSCCVGWKLFGLPGLA